MHKKHVIVFKNEENVLAMPIIFDTDKLARTFIDDNLVPLPEGKTKGDLAVRGLVSIT